MQTTFINLTPHDIKVGDRIFPASGKIARVSSVHNKLIEIDGIPVYTVEYGKIVDLPPEKKGVIYIVSSMVLEAAKAEGRNDCVAPATGHPEVKRNSQGQIDSVPGFVAWGK